MGERSVTADKGVVLATGSVPRDLPFIQADGKRVHNSNHGLEADDMPGSVVVVGGNYIGLEFASIFRSFGAEVTVVEMLPKIAPAEDSDISEALLKLLQKRGIKFELGVKVTDARSSDKGVEVAVERDGDAKTIEADRMFVAIGRAPNTEGMGFEEAGLKLDKGFIVVDQMFSTGVDGVYAIGDAIHVPDANWMHPQLAHVAFIEGIKVAEHLAGENPVPVDYKNIPHIIYCQPEVASVGLTEDKAKELGLEVIGRSVSVRRQCPIGDAWRWTGIRENHLRERWSGCRSPRARSQGLGPHHRGSACDVVGGLPGRAGRADPPAPDALRSDRRDVPGSCRQTLASLGGRPYRAWRWIFETMWNSGPCDQSPCGPGGLRWRRLRRRRLLGRTFPSRRSRGLGRGHT